jgi:hypothetical protein
VNGDTTALPFVNFSASRPLSPLGLFGPAGIVAAVLTVAITWTMSSLAFTVSGLDPATVQPVSSIGEGSVPVQVMTDFDGEEAL